MQDVLGWIKKTVLGSPNWRLASAVQAGDIKKARLAVLQGAAIQGDPEVLEPPLCLALAGGQKSIAIAQDLLDLGADPNEKSTSSGGSAPLHLVPFCEAAPQNAVVLTQLLLKAGANAKQKNNRGETPLTLMAGRACRSDNWALDVCRLLLSYGADPDEPGGSGLSARMMFINAEQEAENLYAYSSYAKKGAGASLLREKARVAREEFESLCEASSIENSVSFQKNSNHGIRVHTKHRL